jgi:hypothetical protein
MTRISSLVECSSGVGSDCAANDRIYLCYDLAAGVALIFARHNQAKIFDLRVRWRCRYASV